MYRHIDIYIHRCFGYRKNMQRVPAAAPSSCSYDRGRRRNMQVGSSFADRREAAVLVQHGHTRCQMDEADTEACPCASKYGGGD